MSIANTRARSLAQVILLFFSLWLTGDSTVDHPLTGVMECGVCASNFQLVGGKGGGYYGCLSAHRKGICENNATLPIAVIEKAVFKILGEKLADSKIIPIAVARYHKALQAKLSTAPARLKQIEEEVERVDVELKNLINLVI